MYGRDATFQILISHLPRSIHTYTPPPPTHTHFVFILMSPGDHLMLYVLCFVLVYTTALIHNGILTTSENYYIDKTAGSRDMSIPYPTK